MDQLIPATHVRNLVPWTGAAALIEPEPWVQDAACAEVDPEAFFPDKGGSTRNAKTVCKGCDVADECLAYALRNDERFGIWGGKSERDRRKLRTSPSRGSDIRDGGAA
jgi:WhiB family redox-sensing transcriptional regulator